MLNIELMVNGLDNVLRETEDALQSALESRSKVAKDKLICKALGYIGALWFIIGVESDSDAHEKVE